MIRLLLIIFSLIALNLNSQEERNFKVDLHFNYPEINVSLNIIAFKQTDSLQFIYNSNDSILINCLVFKDKELKKQLFYLDSFLFKQNKRFWSGNDRTHREKYHKQTYSLNYCDNDNFDFIISNILNSCQLKNNRTHKYANVKVMLLHKTVILKLLKNHKEALEIIDSNLY